MSNIPRRVVTGHEDDGRSVIVSDGAVPGVREVAERGVTFFEVWRTDTTPAPLLAREPSEPTAGPQTVSPPAGGTRIRICEFGPGHVGENGLQSPMHRTASIDYGIVLEGEMVLVVDDAETVLHPGDVVVQRGTDHAWANRTDHVARMAFILVGGEFTDALRAMMPPGATDRLME
jgi:mannose-6-phosphate isomerase-like protein (cupin superfamily)